MNILDSIADIVENILYLISGGFWYEWSIAIWNMVIGLVCEVVGYSPETFSSPAWSYIVNTVYSFMLSIGAILMNLFYMAGLIKSCKNLKESLTLEILLDGLINVMIANFVMLNGLELMKILFKISCFMSTGFLTADSLSFRQSDVDFGASIFMLVFGMIYFIVSLVCSALVFVAVYGRFLHLYVLIGMAPIAWATIPGGHGINSTASAWLRTFLAKTFETVIIAIFIGVGAKMCSSINFGQLSGLGTIVDGAIQMLQNMATMVILAASVKGSEYFLKKAMAL